MNLLQKTLRRIFNKKRIKKYKPNTIKKIKTLKKLRGGQCTKKK